MVARLRQPASVIAYMCAPQSTHHNLLMFLHSIVHRAVYENDAVLALEALEQMDTCRTLHPHYKILLQLVGGNEKYNSSWAARISQEAPRTKLLVEGNDNGDSDKEAVFEEFLLVFKYSLIGCDYQMAHFYISRLEAVAAFHSHVTTAEAFVANRYFEHLFYPLVTQLFSLWFPRESAPASTSTKNPSSPAAIEKRAHSYFVRSAFLQDQPGVEQEFRYYYLIKWVLAFLKFTNCNMLEYAADFEALQPHLLLLSDFGFFQQALVMYSVASIATKPFVALTLSGNESLVDLYTGGEEHTVEAEMFAAMGMLSRAEYGAAKLVFRNETILRGLQSYVGFALPHLSRKAPRVSFWNQLCGLVDQKAFLLILSFTQRILRQKLLQLLGYENASSQVRDQVSNNLVLVCSALALGEVGVSYDLQSDTFTRLELPDKEKTLKRNVASLDHKVRANASSTMVNTLLMQRLKNA